jgi:hypothetical protein
MRQGRGVFVGETTGVFVATGVLVTIGVAVLVGIDVLVGMLDVGVASKATRVNSAATVSAACVKAASGETGVACSPGRLQLAKIIISTIGRQ